jgi:hypothetical protein
MKKIDQSGKPRFANEREIFEQGILQISPRSKIISKRFSIQ